jgi:hypothetical protein
VTEGGGVAGAVVSRLQARQLRACLKSDPFAGCQFSEGIVGHAGVAAQADVRSFASDFNGMAADGCLLLNEKHFLSGLAQRVGRSGAGHTCSNDQYVEIVFHSAFTITLKMYLGTEKILSKGGMILRCSNRRDRTIGERFRQEKSDNLHEKPTKHHLLIY